MQHIKGDSSKWIKSLGEDYGSFYWQDGYGAFSVGPKQINAVMQYIENQEEHHRHIDYKNEFRGFMNRYGMEFDERYVWD